MKQIDEELFGVVHRKQKINSKVKGNRNELAVAKLLTDWTGHEFVRVPMSGGLRWANRVNICGDLISADPTFYFPFSVETKHVKNVGIIPYKCTLRINSIIYTYFAQCQRDAAAVNKHPFLIIRQNGMQIDCYYIFLNLTFIQTMKIYNYITPKYEGKLFGFESAKFFNSITYETLKWIYDGKY
jgi:hypothetical protein